MNLNFILSGKSFSFEKFFWAGWSLAVILCLVSSFAGFLTLNTPIILLVSVVLGWKFLRWVPAVQTPRVMWGVGLVALALAAFPLLLTHPYFDVSTDALHTIIIRVLDHNDRVPATFQPYADYPLVYPTGFHTAALHVVRLLPFQDYLTLWALGLLFVFSLPIFVFHLFTSAGAKTFPAIVAGSLVIGTPIFFFNQFTGLYPALLSGCLGLWTIQQAVEKKPRYEILAASAWVVHPGVALYMTFFLVTFLIWKKRHRELIQKKHALIFMLPLLPLVINFFHQNAGIAYLRGVEITLPSLLFIVRLMILNIGWVAVVVWAIALAYYWKNKNVTSGFSFWNLHAFASIFIFLVLVFFQNSVFIQSGFHNKITEYAALSILGAAAFSSWWSIPFSKRNAGVILGVILILSIHTNLTDDRLNDYRTPQEKTSLDAAQFAVDFYAYDSRVRSVFFATPHGSKISQYANKAPYDYTQHYFVPPYGVPADENVESSTNPHVIISQKWKKIMDENAWGEINSLPVEYVVAPSALQITTHPPVLESHGYKLYRTPI